MSARELFLLSPYQYPAQYPMTLGNEDMAGWMNAYTALWHPAVLWGAAGPPKVDSPYEYDDPQSNHVYAVPCSPPMMMAEDWPDRVKETGAVFIEGLEEREETLQKAKEAYALMAPAAIPDFNATSVDGDSPNDGDPDTEGETKPAKHDSETAGPDEPNEPAGEQPAEPVPSLEEIQAKLLALEPEKVQPFFAIGLGYLLLASLSEAMEHENLLETDEFWNDVQRAIAELVGVPYPKSTTAESETTETSVEEPSLFPDEPGDEDNAGDQQAFNELDYNTPAADSGMEEYEDTPSDYPEGGEYESQYDDYNSGYSSGSQLVDPSELEPWHAHLHAAAQRLLSAREVLYPVNIYLLDLLVLDEKKLEMPWPESFERNLALNIMASSSLLEKLKEKQPERFESLREKIVKDQAEVCGGGYLEREDNLLPIESQLWNLRKGREVAEGLLGRPVEVFARKRFGAHPQLPLFLSSTGFNRALLLSFDDSAGPQFTSTVVSWPSPDGKQVDTFVRAPQPADNLETFYNLGHYLFKTIREDHSATLSIVHTGKEACPWYGDFLELCKLGPIFGEWMTFTRYFNEGMSGEYTDTHAADEFHFDYLTERTGEGEKSPVVQTSAPVSGFGRHLRLRRRLDTCWSLAAMQRGLAGANDPLRIEEKLGELEDKLENSAPNVSKDDVDEVRKPFVEAEKEILAALSDRLLSRATENEPGYLLLNACSFTRRIALELPLPEFALPIRDPVKACQLDEDKMLVVVDIPALGFAWIPKCGPVGTAKPTMRIRLADDNHVRNEFFEAEIDTQTGGLKSIADRRNPINRLSQRLVFNPGSVMQATSVKSTSVGPALGEVISEGAILGEREQVLAMYRQRFRAWLGRPVLEMRIEIFPEQPAAGYPWHAYYGSRFAWGDERMMMLRGVNGISYITSHIRPQTPEFIEFRGFKHNTVLFPGGLPFIRRHENRMLDVILIPQHETSHTFDLAVALDREYPAQTALGLNTPVSMIETDKGPPHIGSKGWLYHLDTPHLLMTSMRPGGLEVAGSYYPSGEEQEQRERIDAMTVRLMECASQSGQAEFRCVRNPKTAAVLDARGERLLDAMVTDDTVFLEVTPNDYNQLQIEFS